ncbi:MAG: hypothetical protein PHU51_05765 [Candidatus Nanoarchaeia archaeon]|nr:hypothetical protein [Candidatus Nanoarchaeia archaeon]
MKLVFICNYGQNRSPTAARLAEEIGEEFCLGVKTSYMGLFPIDTKKNELKKRQVLKEADRIFIMTEDMRAIVISRYNSFSDKIICLNVEDEYDIHGLAGSKMREMLERDLRLKLIPYINNREY